MNLHDLVSPGTRVIDVGVRDALLAAVFAAVGAHRYLGLMAGPHLASFVPPADLAGRFQPLVSADQIRHNNAQLLILREAHRRALWAVRDLKQVDLVAVEVSTAGAWAEVHVSQAISRLMRKVVWRGRYQCGGSVFEVFELRDRARPGARHYLSEVVGVAGLIERLQAEQVRYSALRWFEELPALEPGEDLDLLVADADLALVHDLLAEEPGTIPVDVYSETGLEGAEFRGMAYYPPTLATGILDGAVLHPSGCLVPAPEDHLHSLAYHAVYHKGVESGLPSRLLPTLSQPDHNYGAALTRIAGQCDRQFPTVLEEVDLALLAAGWRPPLDTLRRLVDANPWVQHRFFPTAEEEPVELPEVTAFFIRERTLNVLSRSEIMSVFESLEFEILWAHDLSAEAMARSAEAVRGGNWGRGPFAVSGGDPLMLVVAVHYGPRRPGAGLLQRYPRLTNGDVLHAKVSMRDLIETRVGSERSFNPVHSSDDEFETWEYLRLAVPEQVSHLEAEVLRRRADYRTTIPVREVLSTGRRAKVEVVEGEDGKAVVRKTFAPHAQRHFQRELQAMRDLAGQVDAVPAVLRSGLNWFETERFDNTLSDLPDRPDGRHLVPLEFAREMVAVLRRIHAYGADLIDAKPHNFLYDPQAGLKLVDFEFFHRYDGDRPKFEDIYSFSGLPSDYEGDVPFGPLSYQERWEPFVGLSRRSLLHDPPWRQRLNRTLYLAGFAGGAPARLARSTARASLAGVRGARARIGSAYRRWARARATILV